MRCRILASCRVRIAFSMKFFLETAPVAAASFACSWRSANAGGSAWPYVSWDMGSKRHACTCTAVLVPLQHIFGFGRNSSPPTCGGNLRGRKWMCYAHVHNLWPPREVQEEVTAPGVELVTRQEPCLIGGAAEVGGDRCIRRRGGRRRRWWGYGGRYGGHCRAGRISGIGHSGSG